MGKSPADGEMKEEEEEDRSTAAVIYAAVGVFRYLRLKEEEKGNREVRDREQNGFVCVLQGGTASRFCPMYGNQNGGWASTDTPQSKGGNF